jgi:hypothetical protein
MHLDSARELKQQLSQAIVAAMAAPATVKTFGLSAQPMAEHVLPRSVPAATRAAPMAWG